MQSLSGTYALGVQETVSSLIHAAVFSILPDLEVWNDVYIIHKS